MNFYFIFINLISLAVQKDLILLIENIFNNHENEKINIDYCKQYANDSFHYKEIQSKIDDIDTGVGMATFYRHFWSAKFKSQHLAGCTRILKQL